MTRYIPKQRLFLKEWRKHRQLTQEQLAARLDVDRTIVSKIERGKLQYSQGFLEAAADALMCEPADLIVRDPTTPERIWSIWDNIPDHEREHALAILKTFTKPTEKTGT